MIVLVWGSSFKRAYKKMARANPAMKSRIGEALQVFVADPFASSLQTHKLSGKMRGLWAFTVEYDCRIVFRFLKGGEVLLIDIGKHDEVY
ncbi:MAG: type II toxin-antitoxin system mRNA interferase toxin, RelE/StbE family [Dehalococcoidia bacterium]